MNSAWRFHLTDLFAWLERFPRWAFQAMFRLAAAGVFWESGMLKLDSWQTTLVLFRDEYRVPLLSPEVAAYLATAIELTCPVLLVIGLATRLAVMPLLAMTLVIQLFVYPDSWIAHLTWAAMLLFILTRGPGVLSLDHVIARRFMVTAPESTAATSPARS